MRTIELHWQNRDINDIEGEIWKDVPNTDGLYQASNFGRVKLTQKEKYFVYEENKLKEVKIPLILAQQKNLNGYLRVSIKYLNTPIKGYFSHKIISEAFNVNTFSKPIVHHIINERSYNFPENLIWVTYKENSEKKITDTQKANFVTVKKISNSPSKPRNSLLDKGFVYIYCLLDKDKNIFYIGQSINPEKRIRSHIDDAKKKPNANGVIHYINKIISNGDTFTFDILKKCKDSEWRYWEKYYIKEYRGKHPIVNISDGAWHRAESSIALLTSITSRKIIQYELTGKFIREWKSIASARDFYSLTKKSIGIAIKENGMSGGFLWTLKVGNEIPLTIPPYKEYQAILQYSLTGYFIAKFTSTFEAAEILGLKRVPIHSCAQGLWCSSQGFIWKWWEEDFKLKIEIEKSEDKKEKTIFQILPNGEKIKFNSIKDACSELKINRHTIAYCIERGKPVKGLMFSTT